MKRSATVAFYFLVAGFQSPALALQPGDTLGGHLRVLTPSECQDLRGHQLPAGDGSPDADADSGSPSSPVSQSNVQASDLDKKGFNLKLFSYRPDGAPGRIRADHCAADDLQRLIFQNREIGAQSAAISSFFAACSETVKRQGDGDLGSLLKTASADYDVCDNPRIHPVEVLMKDGSKLRGLLALQDSTRALPFIIYKDGAFGNANSSSVRMALMALFDQAPVNMLALGNVTGSDYLSDNGHIALGGFDEGMQVVEVAKLLRTSALAPRISEIQLMGISLGGEAALFASYYNSWQPKLNGEAPLSSIFAMSPVVNLESSMNSLFSPGLKWKVVRKFLLGDFFETLAQLPFLSGVLGQLRSAPAPTDIPDIIAQGAIGYYSKVPSTWGLAPYKGLEIRSPGELWSRNNFLPIASMNLTTPTLVLGAQTDWVVEPSDNSLALKTELASAPGDSKIKVVMLDRGNHCAFGPALGWDLYSAFLMGYEISHSPSLLARRHDETAAIPEDDLKKFGQLNDDEMTVDYHFLFAANKDYMKITIDQTDDQNADDEFCDLDAEELGSDCLKRHVVKIGLAELPAWARQPVNDADAQALTRWVNTNVRLVSGDGTPVGLNNKNPVSFKWVSYE